MLERIGYKATAVSNSLEALRIFKDDPSAFDLVITDQTMPGMAGLRLSREILKLRPDMPIIMATGHSASVSAEKAKRYGIKKFLMKPLVRSEVRKAVKEVLEASSR